MSNHTLCSYAMLKLFNFPLWLPVFGGFTIRSRGAQRTSTCDKKNTAVVVLRRTRLESCGTSSGSLLGFEHPWTCPSPHSPRVSASKVLDVYVTLLHYVHLHERALGRLSLPELIASHSSITDLHHELVYPLHQSVHLLPLLLYHASNCQ